MHYFTNVATNISIARELHRAWLARKLHEFGVEMQAGQTVLSGSFIKAHPIEAGDTFVADYGSLGQISFGVTE